VDVADMSQHGTYVMYDRTSQPATHITSSSATADRPCDCLRPKISLCSCRHCQWFCAGLARH